jgi:hypothetical protein
MITVKIQNTETKRDYGIIRVNDIGEGKWTAEFVYDNGKGEVQILRRSFFFYPSYGNIMMLLAKTFLTLDIKHMEGNLDADIPSNLAGRLGGGKSPL